MKKTLLGLIAACAVLLASCGGGGAGGAGGAGGNGGDSGFGLQVNPGDGANLGGSDSGDGSITSAGGAGSGGTGITGGGVGSGGTGVSVGPISGFGSIIVNGVEYDVDSATVTLEDATLLQLGMMVEVRGSFDATTQKGVATQVVSAADARGVASAINTGAGTFQVLGTTVTSDSTTVWDGVPGLTGLANGDPVQVYGLLQAVGTVRATRVEKLATAGTPVLSGTVQNLNPSNATFDLGSLHIHYGSANFVGGLNAAQLVNGSQVRVRAAVAPAGGTLQATRVQSWYAVKETEGAAVNVSGVVSNYVGLGSFQLMGVQVNAESAKINGGPSSALGNGVTVEAIGVMRSGVLVASKLKIRHVPGTGGPSSFSVSGTIGAYVSPANFRVKGNPVNASAAGIGFQGGTAANLRNGVKISIVGSQVVNGVLQAQTVTFTP